MNGVNWTFVEKTMHRVFVHTKKEKKQFIAKVERWHWQGSVGKWVNEKMSKKWTNQRINQCERMNG